MTSRSVNIAVPFVAALLALGLGTSIAWPAPGLASSEVRATPSSGEDAFYLPPSPLPNGRPGDVIRTQDLGLSPHPDARVQRVMYLSTDIHDRLVPVTGMLLTPALQGSGDDNPLVVHTPGTRGLGDFCAPSKQAALAQANPGSPDYGMGEYQRVLAEGISVVVTDYAGGGTPGDPQYLVGESAGRNALDAQRVKGSGLSSNSPVGISGYSQGGQAAAWAAELQPIYAPELRLKGVLAGGVPADVLRAVRHLNEGTGGTGVGVALASLVGLNQANPELDLDSRLTPEGRQLIERVKQACYIEDVAGFATTSVGRVTSPDVLADPEWQRAYRASLLGTKEPGAPVYLLHGTADELVPVAQADMLFHQWCARGASVQYEVVPGLEHFTTYFLAAPRGLQWLVERIEGAKSDPGCHEVGLP